MNNPAVHRGATRFRERTPTTADAHRGGRRDRATTAAFELLLSHFFLWASAWAIGAAVYADNPRAVSLLLDSISITSPDETAAEGYQRTRRAAAANASHQVVGGALLAASTNPRSDETSDAGISALRLRQVSALGRTTTSPFCCSRAHGARDDSTEVDRFLGACLNADRISGRGTARPRHPELPEHG